MNIFLVFTFIIISHASTKVRPELIDSDKMVCTVKANDGQCCTLSWNSHQKYHFSCPDMVCAGPSGCRDKLPVAAFDAPKLEGQILKNCSKAITSTKSYELSVDPKKGLIWSETEWPVEIAARPKLPVCLEDESGKKLVSKKPLDN